MELKGKHVGLAVTGSFCTFAKIEQEIRHLKETGAILHPVFSGSVQSTDSRFGDTGQFMDRRTQSAPGTYHREEKLWATSEKADGRISGTRSLYITRRV